MARFFGIKIEVYEQDGEQVVRLRDFLRGLEFIKGGGQDPDPDEELERQMWLVPPAGVLAVQSLLAMYRDQEFTARRLWRDTQRGMVRPLIDAFGHRLRTPDDAGRFLGALVEHPPEYACRLQRRGERFAFTPA